MVSSLFFLFLHVIVVVVAVVIAGTNNRRRMLLPRLAWLHYGAVNSRLGERPAVQILRVQQKGLHRCTADWARIVFAQ